MTFKKTKIPRAGRLDIATAREAAESPDKIERGHPGYRQVPLTALDLVRCSRCGLRGHAPGDSEKCYPERSFRMGCWR